MFRDAGRVSRPGSVQVESYAKVQRFSHVMHLVSSVRGQLCKGVTPFAAFSTKDGHIVIAVGTDQLFAKLAEALGSPGLAQDPRYASNPLRMEHWHELHEDLEVVLSATETMRTPEPLRAARTAARAARVADLRA